MGALRETSVWLQCPVCGFQYEAWGTPGNPSVNGECPNCGYHSEDVVSSQPIEQNGIAAPAARTPTDGNRTNNIIIAMVSVAAVAALAIGAYLALSNQGATTPVSSPSPAVPSAQSPSASPAQSSTESAAQSPAASPSAARVPAVTGSLGSLDGDVFTCEELGFKVVPNENVELEYYSPENEEEVAYVSYLLEDAAGHYIGDVSIYIAGDVQFDARDWFLDSGTSAQPAQIAGLDFWYEVENVEYDTGLETQHEYVRVASDTIIDIVVYEEAGSGANELFLSAISAI